MEVLPDRFRQLPVYTCNGTQLLNACAPNPPNSFEMFQKGGFSLFPHTRNLIQRGLNGLFAALFTVIRNRRTVGFITDALNKKHQVAIPSEIHRVGSSGLENPIIWFSPVWIFFSNSDDVKLIQ